MLRPSPPCSAPPNSPLTPQAETSKGPINFHDYIKGSWAILFSHPDDYTPVCTTELSAVALSHADFESRGVKVGVVGHVEWNVS